MDWAITKSKLPAVYLFLAAIDLAITSVIYLDGYLEEKNPLARAALEHGGLPGLAAFKAAFTLIVLGICWLCAARNSVPASRLILWIAIGMTGSVVAWSSLYFLPL